MIKDLATAALGSTFEHILSAIAKDSSAHQRTSRLLWPLEREDSERGNNLVATLRTYYACGMRVDRTAESMFLHRNSVRYRLDRIRSLLHLDIDHPQTIAAFTLALKLAAATPQEVSSDAV